MSTEMESFAQLFEESLARKEMRLGEVITAEVVRVDYNVVVVNAGLKSEAYVPIEEFKNDRGEVEVKAGDLIQVAIEALENGYSETRLSRDKAKRLASWYFLENAMNQGDIVSGMVVGKVKGGLTVMTQAFAPSCRARWLTCVRSRTPRRTKARTRVQGHQARQEAQQCGGQPPRRARSLDGRRARKAAVDAGRRRHRLGTVKNITDYGAFVDLGGIDGLLHITDLAWRRVKHPSEVLTVGSGSHGQSAQVRPGKEPCLAGPQAAGR